VLFASGGALLIAGIQAFQGADLRLVIESFFVGILIFCPCLFAAIIPLMKQIVHLALLKRGIMVNRADALLDLAQVRNFYFDKTGTLEAVESCFVPLQEGDESVVPYLNALAERSKHPILRGLQLTGETKLPEEIKEHPGQGVEAKAADGTAVVIGRASFLREMGIGVPNDSAHPYVSVNRVVVGQLLVKSVFDSDSRHFLKKLLAQVQDAKVDILSGDPAAAAGVPFTGLDQRISYRGNLSPDEKAAEIRGQSAFVGDGLNDTLALAKASVGFRLGHRVLGFAPVDFHLQSPDLDLILTAVQYSKK
jgi:Cu2+-exporting ATPase